jgi:hypothetical protein
MTFWFCYSCKRTWHSFVRTPDNVNKIRCFYCLDDYDKNLRKFKMLKNKEINGRKYLKKKK